MPNKENEDAGVKLNLFGGDSPDDLNDPDGRVCVLAQQVGAPETPCVGLNCYYYAERPIVDENGMAKRDEDGEELVEYYCALAEKDIVEMEANKQEAAANMARVRLFTTLSNVLDAASLLISAPEIFRSLVGQFFGADGGASGDGEGDGEGGGEGGGEGDGERDGEGEG